MLLQPWFWLAIVWAAIAAPLATLKSVKVLGYTSAIAVACVLYTTAVVIMYASGILDPCAKEIPAGETCVGAINATTPDVAGNLTTMPIFFTAFACAPTVFNVRNDLQRPSISRMTTATVVALGVCCAQYLVVALSGYFTYGDNLKSNILNSFPVDIWATLARIGTAFVVTVSYLC